MVVDLDKLKKLEKAGSEAELQEKPVDQKKDVRVHVILKQEIDNRIKNNPYGLTRSNFIRLAIVEKLNREGI